MRGQCHGPAASLPPGKTRYPLYSRLGGPQGRSGHVRKISHQPGFDLRIIYPVGGHYTDYATRPMSDIKCTLVQALRLCTGRTAHSGSRGIALLFHDHGSRRK